MGKILLWALVIICVLFVARLLSHQSSKRVRQAERTRAQSQVRAPSEQMVRCAHCGIHLPRSEALLLEGRTWCGTEHARLGPKEGA